MKDVEVHNPLTESKQTMSEVFVYVGDAIDLDGLEEEAVLQFRYQEELVPAPSAEETDVGENGGDGATAVVGGVGDGGEIAGGVDAAANELGELLNDIQGHLGDDGFASAADGDLGDSAELLESIQAFLAGGGQNGVV